MRKDALANVLARRRELMAELAKIDAWLARYQEFEKPGLSSLSTVPSRRTRIEGLDPRQIADLAASFVEQSVKPQLRKDIAAHLIASGVKITAADPVQYVGVQLWRHAKDRVRALPGGGFVPLTDPPDAGPSHREGDA